MTLTEEQGGFDLEKARASIAHYRIENPSNVDTESALKELVDQANLAEDALAEIERLRANEKSLSAVLDRQVQEQAARIKSLKKEIRRLKHESKVEVKFTNSYIKKLHDAEARIEELEAALVEERAKQFDVDEPCPARTHHEYCDILKGLCDGFPHMWEQCQRKQEKLDAARRQLQTEGKIGLDQDANHKDNNKSS